MLIISIIYLKGSSVIDNAIDIYSVANCVKRGLFEQTRKESFALCFVYHLDISVYTGKT